MAATEVATITGWSDPKLEGEVLATVSLSAPWPVVERFASLHRLSGSADERAAIDLLRQRLSEWGVSHELYEPTCFISLPGPVTLREERPGGREYFAKTSAMSRSTDGREVGGELVYVPSGGMDSLADVVSGSVDLGQVDVAGKVVVTEGMPFPGKVTAVMNAGALAGIFISPGARIHESICTTIWGTPDLDSVRRQPTIPVLGVNNADGAALIDYAKTGGRVAFSTKLDTGWRPIPVLVAEIRGTRAPEEFVLLHGHLDSWHEGIGDNATGDATMLEIARVFQRHRDKLDRSLRIAWWSGHSHGRYAGSTWFADTFAIDLAKNCVVQVNCDSPGCRWATTFNELTAMSETEPLIDAAIRETTGITPEPERPPRAGDYSFNPIGISSFYMLSSTMTPETQKANGYYAVGGCGGNIAWHTEDDNLEIADRDNLRRDIKVYAASLLRAVNAPVHPIDWTRTTAEFRRTLATYQEATGADFDFGPAVDALDALEAALDRLYAAAPVAGHAGDPLVQRVNFAQRRLARLLVPVNYSRMAPFWHDPALNVEPLPDLAPATTMAEARGDVAKKGVLIAHLTRGRNRLVWALEQAREVVEAALA